MHTARVQTTFFIGLTLVVFAIVFFIFKPYLTPLFLAFVFYLVFKPLHRLVDRTCHGRKWLSALLTLVLIIVLVLIPFLVFGSLLFDDARNLYIALATGNYGTGVLQSLQDTIGSYVAVIAPGFTVDVSAYVSQVLGWVVDNIGSLFSGFVHFVIGLALMLLALFYFFKDGESFKQKLLLYSPLDDAYDRDIFNHVERAVNSVVRGSLFVALVQGLLIAVGFWFTGIPDPVIWGAVGIVAALIPSVGTSLVMAPGILFLFFTGNLMQAGILFVWGALVVGMADNILRPMLITRSVPIHPLLILLSVLGGIGLFGLVGFVAGPVIVSLLYVLVGLYPHIVGSAQSPRL